MLKIMPTYDARACCYIGLDTTRHSKEDGQIVDHGKMESMVVPFSN